MPTAATRAPAVFIGHGSPTNTLARNPYTEAWRDWFAGRRPRAVVVVSAHWYVGATRVTAQPRPRTVHDFVSGKGALDTYVYPAPGDAALADRIVELLAPIPIERDDRWGFDHGAWVVLAHAFPQADVPVVEVSLDRSQSPAFHHALGRTLGALRDEGVLLLGSGNIVHNLEIARGARSMRRIDWAERFGADVRARLDRGDHDGLVGYERLGPDAALSVPTPDHYLPLLSVLGAQRAEDRLDYIVAGDGDAYDVGMLSFALQ